MIRGLYTASAGMLVESMRSDVISNNLANVDTAGYQHQSAPVRAFPEELISRQYQGKRTLIGSLGTGATVDRERYSFHPGRLHTTHNPLDVALNGPGFFSVQTPEGPRYTRDGRFAVNEAGLLVNLSGHRVRGENGAIYVGDGEVVIDAHGNVSVDGEYRDRLLVVEFPDRTGLEKQGGNLYAARPEAGRAIRFNGTVIQGTLEMANVNVIKEMVNLIEVNRSYEASQKVIQAYDETLGKTVNEIAGR